MSDKKKIDKAKLKGLRETRKAGIERARKAIKEQKKITNMIRDQLKQCGKTIPEIVVATGLPSDKVLIYVASLKKYGEVVEGQKDGDYFKYELVSA